MMLFPFLPRAEPSPRPRRVWSLFLFFASAIVGAVPGTIASAAETPTPPPWQQIGEGRFAGWSGFAATTDAGARLAVPGTAVFQHARGKKGWHHRGFRVQHDGAADWRAYAGLVLDVEVGGDRAVELTVALCVPNQSVRVNYLPSTRATTRLARGSHRIFLPWSAFDFQQAQPAFLKFIEQVRLETRAVGEGGAGADLLVKSVRAVRGEFVALHAEVRGKSVPAGGVVEYRASVSNCSDLPQAVVLTQEKYGWEAMACSLHPSTLDLAPGETKDVVVRVRVPSVLPPGGSEKQIVKAIANGRAGAGATVTFMTGSELAHPYVLHTPARWQAVRDKVSRHAWAAKSRDDYVTRAERWRVPEIAPPHAGERHVDNKGSYLFMTAVEHDLMAAGIAYQLTGDTAHAEKVRTFLLRLSDPERGYPATLRGCSQSLVQEGHFFQHIAMAYDMALPSGLFSDAQRAQIERTFRLYIETIDFETSLGAINNWNLSEICGALYCALALQDLETADRFFRGPGGVTDHLSKGVLDDGWWYECSISYNVWCTTEFSQVALAMEPWGVNFRDMEVPVSFVPNFSIIPWGYSRQYGMSFEKWGPVTRPSMNIKRMWDALPRFTDFRGVMFGVNDATERRVTGEPYEIAYFLYRDPAYATLIKQGGGARDLLYGVPELPEKTPEKFRDSSYADNVGLALLRSQTPDRPIREQIQAVLHYGTHGGYHGHFDRTNLLHLSRYGRSFYNPEMVWYSYAPYMYKFYVQNSTSKNMVVVDRKMQEPVESKRLLFHTGRLMQAAAVETHARWSTPPYGGMVYSEQGYASFAEKAFGEGRSLPIPKDAPEYGSVTDFTEPILQRRLMIVTDDYVVLADYLRGEREHTFESLFQMKGYKGLQAAEKRLVRHDGQWDANPVLDAQFVTDCDWFAATAPSKAAFEMRWGPGADNAGTRALESEDGLLKLDVHALWPREQEIMIGTVPEMHPVEKRLFWTVRADGKDIAQGKFGAWILGQETIDLPIDGVNQLDLETRVELSKLPTVFWAGARVVTRDGRELPLSELPVVYQNVQMPAGAGVDYAGGPIKIVGVPYAHAIPGQPKDVAAPAVLHVDLRGRDAVRFKAVLGGDFPVGDETQRRKTYALKVRGREARFLTIIEPYENAAVVKSAGATGADGLRVELSDGRTQEITIKRLDGSGRDIAVEMVETRAGAAARTEKTSD
jgi:hypothetical protein